uniref:Uncharacterized protein n=1 Tax=Aureoumbra lagunensis TaxID=44058 RepID=A0A7S3JW39_9STRA
MGEAKDSKKGKAYESVLAKWRGEVYAMMVREICRETELTKLQQEVMALKRAELMAQRSLESMELAEARAKHSTMEAREARNQAHALKEQQDELWGIVRRAAKSLTDNTYSHRLSVATARQEEQCARLNRAASRLAVLHTLLEQRETRLRNGAAALAAERRLWQRERRSAELQALSIIPLEQNKKEETIFIGRGLQPQAEALMRGIFVALDQNGVGRVNANLLLKALRSDANLEQLMHHYIGQTAWTKSLDELDEHILHHRRHIHDEGPPQRADLAWGEFLLLFVPKSSDDNEVKEKQLNDNKISTQLLPAVPVLTLLPPSSNTQNILKLESSMGVDALRREVLRLSSDRSALIAELTRVRDWTLRAAQDAALNWRNELRALELRAERAERSSALEMKLKDEALNRIDALSAASAASTATFSALTQSASVETTRALAAKQRLIDSLTAERNAAVATTKGETERLDTALSKCQQERDTAQANVNALEKEITILRDQLQALETQLTTFQTQTEVQSATKAQLTTVTNHRDALLRLLQEQRNSTIRQPHLPTKKKETHHTASSSTTSTSPHFRALASLQALTDDLLDDDDDDYDDDEVDENNFNMS